MQVLLHNLEELSWSMDPISEGPGFGVENILLALDILVLNRLKVVFPWGRLLKGCSANWVGMLMKAFDVSWGYDKAAPRSVRSLLSIHLLKEILLSSLQRIRVRIVECIEVSLLLIQIRIIISAPLSILSRLHNRVLRERVILISNLDRVVRNLPPWTRHVIGNFKWGVFATRILALELFRVLKILRAHDAFNFMLGRTFLIDVWLLIWGDLLLEIWSWRIELIELCALLGLSTTYFVRQTLCSHSRGALRTWFNEMMLIMASHFRIENIFLGHLRTIDSLCVNILNSWIRCLKSCRVLNQPLMLCLEIRRCCPVLQIATSEFINSCLSDIVSIGPFLWTFVSSL